MAQRNLTGILLTRVRNGTARIHFNPHRVTGEAEGVELEASGGLGHFVTRPGKMISIREFQVEDKDTFWGGSERDWFRINDTYNRTNTCLDVTWSCEVGARIREISYLITGEVPREVGFTNCVQTVADLTALASVDLENHASVIVKGYHAPGDGGGGIFYLDEGNEGGWSVDDGTVIAAEDNSVWVRVYDGPIDVRWFGATARDTQPQSDDVYIQRALDSNASGEVFFPPNTYKFKDTVNIRSDTVVIGTGDGSIIKAAQDGINLFTLDYVDNVTIEKLRFCGNNTSYDLRLMSVDAVGGLDKAKGRNLVIVALVGSEFDRQMYIRVIDANGEIVDKPENALVPGDELTTLKQLLNRSDDFNFTLLEKRMIIRCAKIVSHYDLITGNGILAKNATNASVEHCTFGRFGDDTGLDRHHGCAILFHSGNTNINILHNYIFEGAGELNSGDIVVYTESGDAVISGNRCYSENSSGIHTNANKGEGKIVITENICKNHTRHGIIPVYGGSGSMDTIVVGNLCIDNDSTGIYIAAGRSSGFVIANNVIDSCSGGGANGFQAAGGIVVSSEPGERGISKKIVTGNLIYNTGRTSDGRPRRGFPNVPDNYDLRFMSVDAEGGLEGKGIDLVIVALVDNDLHIRIFNSSGERVVDKAENADKAEDKLVSGETLTDLKHWLDQDPFPNDSSLADKCKKIIIKDAAFIAGYCHDVSESTAIRVGNGDNSVIVNNIIDSSIGSGVRVYNQCSQAIIKNNKIVNTAKHGIEVNVTTRIKNLEIVGNHVDNCGCDIRFMAATDDNTEDQIISKFRKDFESRKKECAVLVVRAPNDFEKWTIAGFSDSEEFQAVVIDDPGDELFEELKKEPINECRIVLLATSNLGRTPTGNGDGIYLTYIQFGADHVRIDGNVVCGHRVPERSGIYLHHALIGSIAENVIDSWDVAINLSNSAIASLMGSDVSFRDNLMSNSNTGLKYKLGAGQYSFGVMNRYKGNAVDEKSHNNGYETYRNAIHITASPGAGAPRRAFFDVAAPASGTWNVGDIVYNSSPPVGGTRYLGWVYVNGGDESVWRPFGLLEPPEPQ